MQPGTNSRRGVVLLAVAAFLLAKPAAAQLHDHLECYKVKDPNSYSATVNLLPAGGSPFEVDHGCAVKLRSRQLCFPVEKQLVASTGDYAEIEGQELENAFLCYAVKCPAAQLPPSLQMTDQFGTRTLTGLRTTTVCAPAIVGAPPTTTTTTIPAGVPRSCTNATPPNCDGTCNNYNLSCMADAGACICVSVDVFGPCPQVGYGVPECFGSCDGSKTCIEVGGACQCGFAFE